MIKTKLICHPVDPNANDYQLDVVVTRTDEGCLHLSYQLTGNMTELNIPAAQNSAKTDGLWQHTCFEAFIARKDSPAYLEFNFSPSTQWAIYSFDDYRKPSDFYDLTVPKIVVEISEIKLSVVADIQLPARYTNTDLQLGLTAVIENNAALLTYWAVNHPAEQPDFHLRDGFSLQLPLTNSTI